MAKKKKGFNWKARQQPDTVVDRSTENDVQVELKDVVADKGFDDSNVLALPSKKRTTEILQDNRKLPKKLTKKERKKLEKVLEQKEKKAKRADVLESLAVHQASQDEMNQFVSIAEMQTGKLKRKKDKTSSDITVNTIAGSNKKRRKMSAELDEESETESVHTSDMSSDDDEDSGVISDEKDETLENSENTSCENCEKNRENGSGMVENMHKNGKVIDEMDSTKINNDANSGEKLVLVRTKHHVRGTSGKWTVSELRTALDKEQKVSEKIKTNNEKTVNSEVVTKDKTIKEPEPNIEDNVSNVDPAVTAVKKVVNIPVIRDKDIQDGRLKLPILGEEQIIMEAINENPVVIICGETGSGKTTQVPQFLYEAGYAHSGGIIAVTEPRRVAAISMSNRVATEMSLSNSEVSFQIRYEGNVSQDTKIKFMTDGVLLKEVQQDFLLTKYSVVIIDEAHERSVYTDILIGLLSRIVPLRHKRGSPFKLVIMSATLRVEDFTENSRLFRVKPPVVKVDARQFPVTIHYNKRTPLENYLNEAYRKTCKIHRMLPEGGILLFVTGQQEVHTLCRKLKQTFPLDKNNTGAGTTVPPKRRHKHGEKNKEAEKVELPNINLDNYSVSPLDEEAEREGGSSDLDLSDDENDLGNHGSVDDDDLGIENVKVTECSQPLYVLPLYSLLSSDKQAKVFGPVPEGCRLCVIATNVAETSLTIPGIKYVVDTGKSKTKFYDKVTGVSTFRITWTSKASANQRAGRAGRVGPGHCYRLFSSAVFNDDFEKFSPAEITRRPVDDLILQMKDMNIEKVINFPYPTPPDREQIQGLNVNSMDPDRSMLVRNALCWFSHGAAQLCMNETASMLQAAEMLLISLGALTKPADPKSFQASNREPLTKITPLGRAMSCFPVSPRYSKMLAMGHQHNLLPYVVVIVSAMSVQELFMEVYSNPQDESQEEQFRQRLIRLTEIKRRWAGAGHSLLLGDLMVMLKAVGSCEYEGGSASFCDAHGMRFKAMREVRKLRMQLTNSVNTVIPDASICVDPKMAPPDDIQAKLLRQIVLSGMADHVARKLPDLPSTNPDAKKLKNAYQCPNLEDPVFIHPTSVLYRERPEFVVYQHIEETSKLYMKGITAVEPEWLPLFAESHVTLSKPVDEPPPRYDKVRGQVVCHMSGTFGNRAWPIPLVELEYPTGIEKIKWFARFLLEGVVVQSLKKFTPDLLSPPATMIKTWAKLQPRTETLLKALMSERVDSRETLLNVWKKQPDYLLSAFREWLPESKHLELSLKWPPVK